MYTGLWIWAIHATVGRDTDYMSLITILPIFSALFGVCKDRADNSDMGLDIDTSPSTTAFPQGAQGDSSCRDLNETVLNETVH